MNETGQICEKKLKRYSFFSQGIIGFKLAQNNPYPSGSMEATAWDEGHKVCETKRFGDIARHTVYEDIYV
jgi:hypothetical protein